MALQILYFVPFNLLQPARSFAAVSGKLLVSPVLKKLVFLNSRDEVRALRLLLFEFSAPAQINPAVVENPRNSTIYMHALASTLNVSSRLPVPICCQDSWELLCSQSTYMYFHVCTMGVPSPKDNKKPGIGDPGESLCQAKVWHGCGRQGGG